MLTLDQLAVHKEFRKYLRIQEGIKGNMLNTLINATEKSLPALIREHMNKDFACIYDDVYTIKELLTLSITLKSDEEILVAHAGYISLKALEAYIRFYANKLFACQPYSKSTGLPSSALSKQASITLRTLLI